MSWANVSGHVSKIIANHRNSLKHTNCQTPLQPNKLLAGGEKQLTKIININHVIGMTLVRAVSTGDSVSKKHYVHSRD